MLISISPINLILAHRIHPGKKLSPPWVSKIAKEHNARLRLRDPSIEVLTCDISIY